METRSDNGWRALYVRWLLEVREEALLWADVVRESVACTIPDYIAAVCSVEVERRTGLHPDTMKARNVYHTYRCPVVGDGPERVEFPGGVAVAHNLMDDPLPAEFERCDVFWLEPPWRSGVELYANAARVEPATFEALMCRINSLTARYRVPWCVVAGKSAKPFFDRATGAKEVVHPAHGRAILYLFNGAVTPDGVQDTEAILSWLAGRHQCVGDPMAGFGNVGRIFVQGGKQCVLSDVNRACISVIARVGPKWSQK
jgi:hypothetical protein